MISTNYLTRQLSCYFCMGTPKLHGVSDVADTRVLKRGAFYVVLHGRRRGAWSRDQCHAAHRCVFDADYRFHGRGIDGQRTGRNGADPATRSETDAEHFTTT